MKSIVEEIYIMHDMQDVFEEMKEKLKEEFEKESKAYEELSEKLSKEQNAALMNFENAFSARQDEEMRLVFQYAFKKGAQLMLEIMGV